MTEINGNVDDEHRFDKWVLSNDVEDIYDRLLTLEERLIELKQDLGMNVDYEMMDNFVNTRDYD